MTCFCVPLTPSMLLFLAQLLSSLKELHCCNAPTWYLPLRDVSPFAQPATPGDNFLHVWHFLGDLLSLLHPAQPSQWHKILDCLQTDSKGKTKHIIKIKTHQNKTFICGYPCCFHLPSPAWRGMRKSLKRWGFCAIQAVEHSPTLGQGKGSLFLSFRLQ